MMAGRSGGNSNPSKERQSGDVVESAVVGVCDEMMALREELGVVRQQLFECQMECEGARDEGVTKDEQISTLKDSLGELSELLQEKDGRIQQLEDMCVQLNGQLTLATDKQARGAHPVPTLSNPWWVKSGGRRGLSHVTSDSSIDEESFSTAVLLNGTDTHSGPGDSIQEEVEIGANGEMGLAEGGVVSGPRAQQVWRGGGRARECSCGCAARVQRLQLRVQRLDRMLWGKEDVIGSLRAEGKRMKAELLEFQQQKLQGSISEIDSTIAMLELRPNAREHMERLKADKGLLVAELKEKVSQKVRLFRRDSEDVMGALAAQYQDCNRDQVCEVLRALDVDSVRLKDYIDQLLAKVLERNPGILEGMPRSQLSRGLQPDLMRGASIPELLEDMRDREKNFEALENYATLLLQRAMEHAPDLVKGEGDDDEMEETEEKRVDVDDGETNEGVNQN